MPGVGLWRVDDDKVTFKPVETFRGMEATVQCSISIDGVAVLKEIKVPMDGIKDRSPPPDPITERTDKTMRAVVPLYTDVMNCITRYMNAMSPSAAMAGIYTMVENFLTSVRKAGGLAGAVPSDAFSVHVGLGETMTSEDMLEGKLLITVLVAVSRPAEFIGITFQQQMQKS